MTTSSLKMIHVVSQLLSRDLVDYIIHEIHLAKIVKFN